VDTKTGVAGSPGFLQYGITMEELYKPHSSTLRNKGLAEVLYDTELIESWGSGIRRMFKEADDLGLPQPEIIEIGMRVQFIVYLAEPLVLPPETELGRDQVGTQSLTQLPNKSDGLVQMLLSLNDREQDFNNVIAINHRKFEGLIESV